MASSGSFNTSAYNASDGPRYLVFSWEEVNQSITNNTTTISWSLEGGGSSRQYVYTGNVSVVIAGKLVFSMNNDNRIQLRNGTHVASGTFTFTHKDDGTQGFTASVEGGIYTYDVNCTGSGTFTLDTIARASQPSLVTWPETTNDVGDFGEEFGIHMNRKSSSFTHTVRYEYGNRSGVIARDVETGVRWAVPLDFMNDIPNATSGSGRIYVDTYNGSTFVGTKYTGFTATVPASVKPTCSFVLEDVTGIDDIYGSPVKGLSKIKITVNPVPAYSSPITSCVISANGMTYNGTTATTGVLKDVGASRVTATVKDKRERPGTASYDMNVQDYAAPSVSELSVHRCDSDGTTNDQGGYIKVTFSASVTSLNSKNTATYILKYKKSTDTSYTSVALADLENEYSVSGHSYIFEADSNSSYDVEVVAQDRHKTASKSTSGSTAFTLMNFNPQGNGIGIGQVCEKQNTLQIGIDLEIKGKSIIDTVYPVGSIYLAYNHTDPGTLFPGTTWVRIEGAFPWFSGATATIGQTGGERTVTLTAAQIPSHNHGGTYTNAGTARTHAWLASGGSAMGYDTVNTGGGEAHNNMPPYIQISAWRRTA